MMESMFFSVEAIAKGCKAWKDTGGGELRFILEKPFGDNLKSAKKLSAAVLQYTNDESIYRIDHYLGKQLVRLIPEFM